MSHDTPPRSRSATASRCPEPAATNSRSRCACRRCPSARRPRSVFPAWAPGSYMVRDFVRHVYGLDDHRRARAAAAARAPRQAALAGASRRARVPRALPRVRVRAQRAHVVPGRQPRLLERHQPVLLRRGRAGAAVPRWRSCRAARRLARRHRAAAGRRRAPAPTRAADFDELVDSPVRGRHARGRARSRVGRAQFELALYGRTNADAARLVDILRRVVDRDRPDLRRLPVRALPVHRPRAAGRRRAASSTAPR